MSDDNSTSSDGITPTELEHQKILYLNLLPTPHPNVAVFRHTNGVNDHSFSCENPDLTSLKDKLNKSLETGYYLEDEYRKRILLQVTHGLKHYHDRGIKGVCVNERNVMFSEQVPDYIVIFHSDYGQNTCADVRSDVAELAKLFEYVLKSGQGGDLPSRCRDPVIAGRLLADMRVADYDTHDILRHPFFWSDDKKINFLLRSTEVFYNNRGLQKELNEKIRLDDWMKLLSLTAYEVTGCDEYIKRLLPHEILDKDVLKKEAERRDSERREIERERNCNVNTNSKHQLFELLIFFRNIKTHFYTVRRPVNCAFQGDETSKYWRFFSKRYPELLIYVYDIMQEVKSLNIDGIREIYIEAECENAPLSSIKSHQTPRNNYLQDLLTK